ncbi:MAG: HNH endonuclease, partial [Calditrichaeota bacterium]
KRIKEEYENGRDYYAMHGRRLSILPERENDRPSAQYLEWHNEHIYLG